MGIWETFCPICGLPNSHDYGKIVKNLEWLNSVTILTSKNQVIKINLRDKNVKYDYTGAINHDKVWYIFYKPEWPKNNHYVIAEDFFKQTKIRNIIDGQEIENLWVSHKNTKDQQYVEAYMIHESCYQLIKNKLKYNVKFCDLDKILHKRDILSPSKYGKEYIKYADSQFNNFKDTPPNSSLLSDPVRNKENSDRIIAIWNPIINKLKNSKCRPSPSMSATKYETGVIKYGNDGNLWINNGSKAKKAWIKLNENNVNLHFNRIKRLNRPEKKSSKHNHKRSTRKQKSKSQKSKSQKSKGHKKAKKASALKTVNNKRISKKR